MMKTPLQQSRFKKSLFCFFSAAVFFGLFLGTDKPVSTWIEIVIMIAFFSIGMYYTLLED